MISLIGLIESYAPEYVYLTHFGQVDNIGQIANTLRRIIADYVTIIRESAEVEDVVAEIANRLRQHIIFEAKSLDLPVSEEKVLSLLEMDMQINAQGLTVWLKQTNSCFYGI